MIICTEAHAAVFHEETRKKLNQSKRRAVVLVVLPLLPHGSRAHFSSAGALRCRRHEAAGRKRLEVHTGGLARQQELGHGLAGHGRPQNPPVEDIAERVNAGPMCAKCARIEETSVWYQRGVN